MSMEAPLVDLKAQYNELRDELDKVVLDVLSSGMYTPAGNVKALEEETANLCGTNYGIATNSGTDALKIGLQAIGIEPGDEVITTPFTFVATVEAILQNGGKPVFVDIDPKTFNMDPAKLEAAVTERTKVILPIHIFGQMADMEAIMEVAGERGISVLEDAAQAIGGTRNGLPCGSWGVAAALSFFPTKNLGAAGDAGMILTNDEKIAYDCRSLRVHGMAQEPYLYEHVGHTSRLDEIQGAILRVKLRRLEDWNERRRAHAAIYDEAFIDSAICAPFASDETTKHPYHQYTIRHARRDDFMKHLRSKKVGCAIYYPVPLHVQPVYSFLGYVEGDFPETEAACREVLSLPVQAHLTEDQVRYAAECALSFN
jgi:dTDP-4-amino-4,6-dideoxygalactose transaminase